MSVLARALGGALLLAIALPHMAEAQCPSVGGIQTLTDGESFVWDIDNAGQVSNGSIDAYDYGMTLQVNGVPFGAATKVLNGREFTVGPLTVSGVDVTRKIYVSDTEGWARWVDLFTNPTAAEISIDVNYQINPGSDSSRTVINTSSGDNTFALGDRWLVTDDSSNGSGDPTLNHNLYDGNTPFVPSAVSNTVFNCAGSQGTNWTYTSIVIPAGKTVGLMTLLGQNSNQTVANAKVVTLDDPSAGLDGLSSADKGTILNRLIPKNILFVADNQSDTNIPSALTVDGHTVTTVTNGYNSSSGATPPLDNLGTLLAYDVVFWSATGTGFGSLNDDSGMISTLETYVAGGGRVYVTGYDSIDSPDDPALAAFVGGTGATGATNDNSSTSPLSPVMPIVTSVTTGLVDLRGVTPSGGYSDTDGLLALASGTVGLAATASNANNWEWVLRPLGAGEVAYVSNGQPSSSQHASWTDPTSVYNATLRNFAFGSGGGTGVVNTEPVADAGGPYTVGQGVALALDGTGSSDVDGTVDLYEWDCTDDGVYDVSSTSPTGSTCTYPNVTTATIRLRVTDDFGDTDEDTATVTVTNDLPTAEANGPYAGNAGVAIALSATGSTDADGTISTYEWDCTTDGVYDTSSASPTAASCTYTVGGAYTATLRVTDDDGGQGTDTASVAVNIDPVADAGGPYGVNVNVGLAPDGSGSTDSDGTIVTWQWDCTNDGSFDLTSPTPVGGGTCTYPAAGSYTLRLRVTDDQGAFDEDTATVAVNGAPVADAGGPYAGNQGTPIALDGSNSFDVEGPIANYAWDCETDGVIDASGPSATTTCTYPAAQVYTATLVVTDAGGLTATDTAVVSASNTAPLADAGGPYTVNQGDALALDGSGSSDPDGNIVEWAWDCDNDGTYEVLGAAATGSVCLYPDDGPQTVGLRVTDNSGDFSTDTASVNVTNTLPVADATSLTGGAYSGTKNNAIPMNGAGSSDADGNIVEWAWDCETDGNVDFTAPTATGVSCTYAAVGTYTVTLTVTDDDGGTGTDTETVNVGNDPPTAVAGGPYSGNENSAIAVDGSGSTDAGGSIVSWAWDCETDGVVDVTLGVPGATCSYDDEGTYTVTLTVTDDDGATDTSSAPVSVSNVDPILVSTSYPTGDEGSSLTFTASATDAAGDTLTYSWDFGDGTTGTGASTTHAYDDEGSYAVTVTVTDGDGGSATDSGTASVSNVDPVFTSLSGPGTGAEGDPLSFSAITSDAGIADVPNHVVTWDWGDGSPTETGTSLTHAFPDDSTYTVTVTIDDGDGGSTTDTLSVVTSNVDPTITTTAPTNAVQGATYTYAPQVSDPGTETFTWTLSPSASPNTVFDPATGLIEWVPDAADQAQGSFSLVLTVDDGDGGSDAQSWTVNVAYADTDGDGMSDDWETANGLDPNDPSDATGDPDADGATNLEEFGNGTDPFSFDGPAAPTPFSPLTGDEVDTERPDLVVDNAVDPQGDTLIYTFEVYSDAALTTLVTSIDTVLGDASGQTTWKVDLPLAENTMYWWRAAAEDSYVLGPFSSPEAFFVNAVEEDPDVPVLVFPIGGEIATSVTPTLQWSEATDPDLDPLTYDVEVYDAFDVLVTSSTGVVGDGVEATWTVDVALTEDATYWWTVRAVDDEGKESAWADLEAFLVSEGNEAPTESVFVAPIDGSSLATLSPDLVATESVDPEGTDVVYLFEIDQDPGFASAGYDSQEVAHTGTGEVRWELEEAGIVLPQNVLTYARVRAVDADGISSSPDTISFFVRGDNDAPEVPVLLSPEDGAEGDARPRFTVEDPEDSEGDVVYLEFRVARDEAMTELVTSVDAVISGAGDGTTGWTPNTDLAGDVYWTARAVDAFGAASDWATPWLYMAPLIEVGDDDDSAVEDPEGCADCNNSVAAGGNGTWLMLVLLPVVAVLRRRR